MTYLFGSADVELGTFHGELNLLPPETNTAFDENDEIVFTGSRLRYYRLANGSVPLWVPHKRLSFQRNGSAAPDFPLQPVDNQSHELLDGTTYDWDGTTWNLRIDSGSGRHRGPFDASGYNQGDSVTNLNGLYEANGPIPAGAGFVIGTTGATFKLIDGQQFEITVVATGSTTTGVEFQQFVRPNQDVVLYPPVGHEFVSSDYGTLSATGQIVGDPLVNNRTITVVLQAATVTEYTITVNASGSATTGVQFQSVVQPNEQIILYPPSGHQFQSSDYGVVLLDGQLVVGPPVTADQTIDVVLETASASGIQYEFVSAEPLAAEGANGDVRLAVSGDFQGTIWKKIADAWEVQGYQNPIGYFDNGQLPPQQNYATGVTAWHNQGTTDNPDWELVRRLELTLLPGNFAWQNQNIGSQSASSSDGVVTGGTLAGGVLTLNRSGLPDIQISGFGGGGTGDYIHPQTTASTVWTITHNQNADIEDISVFVGGEPVSANWDQVDANTATVTFSLAASGTAIVNFVN